MNLFIKHLESLWTNDLKQINWFHAGDCPTIIKLDWPKEVLTLGLYDIDFCHDSYVLKQLN